MMSVCLLPTSLAGAFGLALGLGSEWFGAYVAMATGMLFWLAWP
jgi:hypothetical protein